MINNQILHDLVKDKYGLMESTITNDGKEFNIIGNNGEHYTNKSFTPTEIKSAIENFENKLLEEKKLISIQKMELLNRLGITEDEAKLLLS